MSKKLDHWIVYGLFDPTTEEIRYVGQTSYALHHRLSRHLYEAKKLKVCEHKCAWINRLLSVGLIPVIKSLEIVRKVEDLAKTEDFHIQYFRANGSNLFNETDGGPGSVGRCLRDSTKRKISDANIGRVSPLKGKKGRVHSDESRANMSASRLGRKFSDASKAKMSAAKLGKPSKLKGRKIPRLAAVN